MGKTNKLQEKPIKNRKWYSFLDYIDPFTYLDMLLYNTIGEPKSTSKKILFWIIYIVYAFLIAYILYTLLGIIFGSAMPLATVVSGSMEPAFQRGDVVILGRTNNIHAQTIITNQNIAQKDLSWFSEMTYKINEYGLEEVDTITIDNQTIKLEDIKKNKNSVVVYTSNIKGIPIIHRVVGIIEATDGIFLITKGDNSKTNRFIDQDCEVSPLTGYATRGCLNLYPVNKENLLGKKIGLIPYIGYAKLFLFG
jgi:signal peptidase I